MKIRLNNHQILVFRNQFLCNNNFQKASTALSSSTSHRSSIKIGQIRPSLFLPLLFCFRERLNYRMRVRLSCSRSSDQTLHNNNRVSSSIASLILGLANVLQLTEVVGNQPKNKNEFEKLFMALKNLKIRNDQE